MKNKNIYSCERNIIDLNKADLFSVETLTQEFQKMAKIDEKNKIISDVIVMNLDTVSRNNSKYEAEGYWNSLQDPFVLELVQRGVLFGEYEHPDLNCSRERFITVDKNNISHRNLNYWRDKNNPNIIRSNVQFLGPKGDEVWDYISKGCNMAFSTRSVTPNYAEKQDPSGQKYILKYGGMKFISWDCVRIPGFKNASIINPEIYDASAKFAKESFNKYSVKKRKKEEFLKLLKSQEALPILEDIYGFSLDNNTNVDYSSEGFITIGLDKTKSIKISANTYKINQILCL